MCGGGAVREASSLVSLQSPKSLTSNLFDLVATIVQGHLQGFDRAHIPLWPY